jgi:hypothetical protein
MSTPLSLLGGSGSPAPYAFADQQQQQYFASPPSPSHSAPPGQGQSQGHGHAQLTQNYQQQQHQSIHNSNSGSHGNMALSVLQKQQEEEEELNQMFTRSLSVPPLAPTASAYQRYNMDSVFGSGSTTALDSMGSGSFAPGAGLGMTRPASTGSVNLDGNGCLYNPSLSVPPYSYSGSTANLSSMGMGTIRRDAAPAHYGGFDYQGESSNSSTHSLSVAGGVASIGRGLMGSPQSGTSITRQASRTTADDGNLGLDLDYDYDFDHMLTSPPPMTAVDRDRGLGQGQGQGQGQGPQMAAEQGQGQGQGQSALMQASSSSTASAGVDFVLRRLCDDTYVPTQPWPVRWDVDAFYCSAVIAQLQQFGGVTTISKLRGFLRSRVNATDNIKSVPLKAMLSGYPGFFTVRSNQVTLAPDPNFTAVGGSESSMSGQSPQGPGTGTMRGHVRSQSQGATEFDMRSATGLSPSTSPPSPSFGYGLM